VVNQDTFLLKSEDIFEEAYHQFERFLTANGHFITGVVPSEEALLHFALITIWCTSDKLNACQKKRIQSVLAKLSMPV
jgi:hypothetical protein